MVTVIAIILIIYVIIVVIVVDVAYCYRFMMINYNIGMTFGGVFDSVKLIYSITEKCSWITKIRTLL